MIRPIVLIKTAGIALAMFVLTPLIHAALGTVVSQEASITGEPVVPLLLGIVCLQAVLLVGVFRHAADGIPARRGWRRGLLFGGFFLLAVQIPSVFGIVAFEPGHDWELFTPAKIANYATLFGDTIVFLLVGTLLGQLFQGRDAPPAPRPRGLALTTIACGAAFPLAMWATMHLGFALVSMDDPHAPIDRGLWFDLVFYGAFALTGLCLPWLHAVLRPLHGGRGLRSALRTSLVCSLLWLPVQNFMVVFGWEPWGALFFSALSMLPILAVVALADLLLPTSHNPDPA